MTTLAIGAEFGPRRDRALFVREIPARFARLNYYDRLPRVRDFLSGRRLPTLDAARALVDTIARTVRFTDASGLEPARESRACWVGLHEDGFDHVTAWTFDGGLVLCTEPYGGPEAAQSWCSDHGWSACPLPIWSAWNPPDTTLVLTSPPDGGAPLDPILSRLAAAEPLPIADRCTAGEVRARHVPGPPR